MGSKTSIEWCWTSPIAWRCRARPSVWRGKSFDDRPVAGRQEGTEQRLVAVEHVAVYLDELVVPVGYRRVAPVDDPGEAPVLDERVHCAQIAVDEYAVERLESGEVVVDLRDQMRRERAALRGRGDVQGPPVLMRRDARRTQRVHTPYLLPHVSGDR